MSGNKPPSKFHTTHRGPLKVNRCKNNEYALENLVTGKTEYHHVTNLKPFYFDASKTDPKVVATKDYLATFIVEKIIQHKGDLHGPFGKMTFEVKWEGYTERDNTWEPYSHLRNCSLLHDYVRENNLPMRLIPKQFHNKTSTTRNVQPSIVPN